MSERGRLIFISKGCARPGLVLVIRSPTDFNCTRLNICPLTNIRSTRKGIFLPAKIIKHFSGHGHSMLLSTASVSCSSTSNEGTHCPEMG
ncbi:hypothetical protein JTE90_017677 [Oedothorax gibbosus]|uniref:Uncharacterized protein n=1 Tax=Oedothorax gibbosus TaxID=931172 RepID=A0AAV6UFC8_9ARAC|nr:hypothetical protein JTE90_017677 [Oedothorax gibbosus]